MNDINPQQILSQIRAAQAELQSPRPVTGNEGSGFSTMLSNAISEVNDAQKTSAGMKEAFVTGTSDASLAEVMISAQKADLSFRAMTEVRNKLVTAYQEIMNMPV